MTTERTRKMDYGRNEADDAPARAWLARSTDGPGLFVNGEWHRPPDAPAMTVTNPATGDELTRIVQATPDDVHRAVQAAAAAAPQWAALSPRERGRLLSRIGAALEDDAELFALLETLDTGRPIRDTRREIAFAAEQFHHYARDAHRFAPELLANERYGVTGHIIGWVAPFVTLARQVAPSLAAGNTVVIKPAPAASITALAFAEAATRAGVPAGAINVVTGADAANIVLTEHPDVGKLVFSGHYGDAARLRQGSAGRAKHVAWETYATGVTIVCADADVDSAVEGAVAAMTDARGPLNAAGRLLLLQEGIAPTFIARLQNRMQRVRTGPPLDESTDIGPLISPVQRKHVEDVLRQTIAESITVWQHDAVQPGLPAHGYFYPPTLCTDVAPAHTIVQADVPGPILMAMTFRTPAEAVALANNVARPGAADVWTESVHVAVDVAAALTSQAVSVNGTNALNGTKVPPAVEGVASAHGNGFRRTTGLHAYVLPPGETVAPNDDVAPNAHVETGDAFHPDIDEAVAKARGATEWTRLSATDRARSLYVAAEGLEAHRSVLARDLAATDEVDAAVQRLLQYAAWADAPKGAVLDARRGHDIVVSREPIGVIGIVGPAKPPLLGLISTLTPALAAGNRLVIAPAPGTATIAQTLQRVFAAAGVTDAIHIVTGEQGASAAVLAGHDDVDAVWYFGPDAGRATAERMATGNMKSTWIDRKPNRDWFHADEGAGQQFVAYATRVKIVDIPHG